MPYLVSGGRSIPLILKDQFSGRVGKLSNVCLSLPPSIIYFRYISHLSSLPLSLTLLYSLTPLAGYIRSP